MSHAAPCRVLVEGLLCSHHLANIKSNGVLFSNEGEWFFIAEGGGSKSFLKPLPDFTMSHLLFLAGGLGNASRPVSMSNPLKDLNDSQRRKATYYNVR